MKLIQATSKNLNDILEIVNDAINLLKTNNVSQWQNGYPNKDILLTDIKNKTLYVLESKNQIIGFCNLSKDPDPSYKIIYQGNWLIDSNQYLVIHRLAIRKEYYHTNAAKTLLTLSEQYGKVNHLQSIRVDTHKDNIPMKKLLQKMGYSECGIVYLIGYLDADKERVAFEKLI